MFTTYAIAIDKCLIQNMLYILCSNRYIETLHILLGYVNISLGNRIESHEMELVCINLDEWVHFHGEQLCCFHFYLPSERGSTSSPLWVDSILKRVCLSTTRFSPLTLLHSGRPKLYTILAILSSIGLRVNPV